MWGRVEGLLCGLTFTLSIQASIFSCSTAFLAWEMLVVLLLDMPSFIVWPLEETKVVELDVHKSPQPSPSSHHLHLLCLSQEVSGSLGSNWVTS